MTKDQLNKFRLSLFIYIFIFTCFGVSVKKVQKFNFQKLFYLQYKQGVMHSMSCFALKKILKTFSTIV